MQVEFHDHLQRAQKHSATRVVIRDRYDNVVAFAVEIQPGHVRVCRIEDEDFEEQLMMSGLGMAAVVEFIGDRPPTRRSSGR